MKQLILPAVTLAVIAAVMTACDSKSALAKDIEGIWSNAPEEFAATPSAFCKMEKTFEFKVDDTGKGGTIIISALINVEDTMPQSDTTTQPIELSAAASASVTGIWQGTDDDEIIISLDPKSAVINIAPDAIRLDYNVLDSESAPDMTALRPGAAAVADRLVNTVVTQRIISITRIDDIKVHNNALLECEINNYDVTMRRQPNV